jgi:hypothetical protein
MTPVTRAGASGLRPEPPAALPPSRRVFGEGLKVGYASKVVHGCSERILGTVGYAMP